MFVPHLQFIVRVLDIPVMLQRQVCTEPNSAEDRTWVWLTCPVLCNDWCQVWSTQCFNRGGAAVAVYRQSSKSLWWRIGAAVAVYRQPPTSLLRRRGTPGDFHCCEHASTSSSSFSLCATCAENRRLSTVAVFWPCSGCPLTSGRSPRALTTRGLRGCRSRRSFTPR